MGHHLLQFNTVLQIAVCQTVSEPITCDVIKTRLWSTVLKALERSIKSAAQCFLLSSADVMLMKTKDLALLSVAVHLFQSSPMSFTFRGSDQGPGFISFN